MPFESIGVTEKTPSPVCDQVILLIPELALPKLITFVPLPLPDLGPDREADFYGLTVTDHSPVPFTARATIGFDGVL